MKFFTDCIQEDTWVIIFMFIVMHFVTGILEKISTGTLQTCDFINIFI